MYSVKGGHKMLRVSVSLLQPGMITAHNIYNSEGVLLVSADRELDDQYVARLKTMGLRSIYVKNMLYSGLELPEDLLEEDDRRLLVKQVQQVYKTFQENGQIEIEPLKPRINRLVSEIVRNRHMMVHFVDCRTNEDYLYAHVVNVAMMTVLVAATMEFNEERLRDLAMGAVLHDIGEMLIPDEILNKPGKLTPAEWDVIHCHTTKGFEALRKVRDLSILSAHIAYQHHENFDGSGYPRKLANDDIHEYARLTAIPNMFDALISDRPQRRGFLPHEAYELLMTLSGRYVDPYYLDAFLRTVAIYPIGSIVRLDSGEFGIVTKVLPRLQMRPTISLLADPNGHPYPTPFEMDLTKNLTTQITKVLREEEVLFLSRSFKGI